MRSDTLLRHLETMHSGTFHRNQALCTLHFLPSAAPPSARWLVVHVPRQPWSQWTKHKQKLMLKLKYPNQPTFAYIKSDTNYLTFKNLQVISKETLLQSRWCPHIWMEASQDLAALSHGLPQRICQMWTKKVALPHVNKESCLATCEQRKLPKQPRNSTSKCRKRAPVHQDGSQRCRAAICTALTVDDGHLCPIHKVKELVQPQMLSSAWGPHIAVQKKLQTSL